LPAPGISARAARRFLAGEGQVDAASTWRGLRDFISRFVRFHDDALADLIVLWLMHTYLFRAFRQTPYLHVRGEPGSHASALADILAGLAWNGALRRALVPATVLADAGVGTGVFDLGGAAPRRSETVAQILAEGSSAPGDHLWIDEAGKLCRRCVHSPRAFASSRDLPALGTRAIRIGILPDHPDDETEPFRPRRIGGEIADLVDGLHLFALSFSPDVVAVHENDMVPAPDDVAGPAAAVWEPLLALAVLVDQTDGAAGLHRRMAGLASSLSGDDDRVPARSSPAARAVRLLGEAVDTDALKPLRARWYDAAQVLDLVRASLELPEVATIPDLTALLARLGIPTERRYLPKQGAHRRCYELDPERINDLRERFGVRYVPGALGVAGRPRGRKGVA
jgi:hypothetical protein